MEIVLHHLKARPGQIFEFWHRQKCYANIQTCLAYFNCHINGQTISDIFINNFLLYQEPTYLNGLHIIMVKGQNLALICGGWNNWNVPFELLKVFVIVTIFAGTYHAKIFFHLGVIVAVIVCSEWAEKETKYILNYHFLKVEITFFNSCIVGN